MTILDTYDVANAKSNVVDSSQVCVYRFVSLCDDVIITGPMSLQYELCQWQDKMCVSV